MYSKATLHTETEVLKKESFIFPFPVLLDAFFLENKLYSNGNRHWLLKNWKKLNYLELYFFSEWPDLLLEINFFHLLCKISQQQGRAASQTWSQMKALLTRIKSTVCFSRPQSSQNYYREKRSPKLRKKLRNLTPYSAERNRSKRISRNLDSMSITAENSQKNC